VKKSSTSKRGSNAKISSIHAPSAYISQSCIPSPEKSRRPPHPLKTSIHTQCPLRHRERYVADAQHTHDGTAPSHQPLPVPLSAPSPLASSTSPKHCRPLNRRAPSSRAFFPFLALFPFSKTMPRPVPIIWKEQHHHLRRKSHSMDPKRNDWLGNSAWLNRDAAI
jgi:hypothetical protein